MRFQLPNGKWSDELTDFSQVDVNSAAYIVARYFFSHTQGTHHYGGISSALRNTWPDGNAKRMDRIAPKIHHALHVNGFQKMIDNTKTNGGRHFWIVPPVFPAWINVTDAPVVLDDGAQTEGGPVTRLVISQRMKELYVAIEQNPGRHPREYGELLNWGTKENKVSHVAHTLKNHGYIRVEGKTMAARYFTTGKPLPLRKPAAGGKTVVVQRKPEEFKGMPEPSLPVSQVPTPGHITAALEKAAGNVENIEKQTGGTVVFSKDGSMMVVKDGRLYLPVMGWTLEEF